MSGCSWLLFCVCFRWRNKYIALWCEAGLNKNISCVKRRCVVARRACYSWTLEGFPSFLPYLSCGKAFSRCFCICCSCLMALWLGIVWLFSTEAFWEKKNKNVSEKSCLQYPRNIPQISSITQIWSTPLVWFQFSLHSNILWYRKDPKKNVLQWGVTRSNSPKCCPNVSKTVVWYLRICKRTYRIWGIASLANASEQSQILYVLYYGFRDTRV